MLIDSLFQINTPDTVKCISSSEDGSKVAFADNCGNVTVVDGKGRVLWEKNIGEGTYGISVMKDGNRVVCGGKDCKIRMFNSLGNVEWEVDAGKAIWSLSVDPSGQVIVIGTGDSIVMFTDSGSKLWEYETRRAMVGVGVSRNGENVVACGDEYLYCLDSEGNLSWRTQRSDALWDVDIEKDNNSVFIGGWDCTIYSLDLQGNEIWNYETKGYVRSVRPLNDGGVLAGSHDSKLYRLNDRGEVLKIFETSSEITSVCSNASADLVYAGAGNSVMAFNDDHGINPSVTNKDYLSSQIETNNSNLAPNEDESYEPMFGFGMFDEPSPDTTEILKKETYSENQYTKEDYSETSDSYTSAHNNRMTSYQESNEGIDRGGEYREFAAKVLKGDVKNYLRLGNSAWAEKRLERAAEHFRKATEVDSEEPRAWHNLAVCNYHLSLKRNPDDLESAVASAYEPLKIAKEKGGKDYTSVDRTLKFLASQIGIEE